MSLDFYLVLKSFNDVSRKFHGCLKFQGSFKDVSWKLQECFKEVLWKFQGCFQGSFKGVFKTFLGCLKDVSRKF